MLTLHTLLRLIKDAKHLVQTVVDLPVQPRYLDDDAVVCQAVHECIGQAPCHHVTIVVKGLVIDVDHRFLYVSHLMAKQIYRHCG